MSRRKDSYNSPLGENLKKILKDKKIRQIELAEMMDVNQSTVSDWITGKKYPTHSNIQQLANKLDVETFALTEDSATLKKVLEAKENAVLKINLDYSVKNYIMLEISKLNQLSSKLSSLSLEGLSTSFAEYCVVNQLLDLSESTTPQDYSTLFITTLYNAYYKPEVSLDKKICRAISKFLKSTISYIGNQNWNELFEMQDKLLEIEEGILGFRPSSEENYIMNMEFFDNYTFFSTEFVLIERDVELLSLDGGDALNLSLVQMKIDQMKIQYFSEFLSIYDSLKLDIWSTKNSEVNPEGKDDPIHSQRENSNKTIMFDDSMNIVIPEGYTIYYSNITKGDFSKDDIILYKKNDDVFVRRVQSKNPLILSPESYNSEYNISRESTDTIEIIGLVTKSELIFPGKK